MATIKEVFDTLTDLQKKAVYALMATTTEKSNTQYQKLLDILRRELDENKDNVYVTKVLTRILEQL